MCAQKLFHLVVLTGLTFEVGVHGVHDINLVTLQNVNLSDVINYSSENKLNINSDDKRTYIWHESIGNYGNDGHYGYNNTVVVTMMMMLALIETQTRDDDLDVTKKFLWLM